MHRASSPPPLNARGPYRFTSVLKMEHSREFGWRAGVTVWFRHCNEVLYCKLFHVLQMLDAFDCVCSAQTALLV